MVSVNEKTITGHGAISKPRKDASGTSKHRGQGGSCTKQDGEESEERANDDILLRKLS